MLSNNAKTTRFSSIPTSISCFSVTVSSTFDSAKGYYMEQFNYNNKSRFIVDIIQALHMRLDEFMYNLVHHNPYEMILYIWIHKLYKRRKSCDEAIQLMYRAKKILLLKQNNSLCNNPIVFIPHKPLSMLI